MRESRLPFFLSHGLVSIWTAGVHVIRRRRQVHLHSLRVVSRVSTFLRLTIMLHYTHTCVACMCVVHNVYTACWLACVHCVRLSDISKRAIRLKCTFSKLIHTHTHTEGGIEMNPTTYMMHIQNWFFAYPINILVVGMHICNEIRRLIYSNKHVNRIIHNIWYALLSCVLLNHGPLYFKKEQFYYHYFLGKKFTGFKLNKKMEIFLQCCWSAHGSTRSTQHKWLCLF